MAQTNLHQSTSGRALPLPPARRLWRGFITLIAIWQNRAQQRRELLEADSRILRDLGLSKAEVAAEAAKPFWRA